MKYVLGYVAINMLGQRICELIDYFYRTNIYSKMHQYSFEIFLNEKNLIRKIKMIN